MIEPKNRLDVRLPPHAVVAVTVEFASASSEEHGAA